MSLARSNKKKFVRTGKQKDKVLQGINQTIKGTAVDLEQRWHFPLTAVNQSNQYTVTGLRWEILFSGLNLDSNDVFINYLWVLARVPLGTSPGQVEANYPTMVSGQFYGQDINAIAWGQGKLSGGEGAAFNRDQESFSGTTKSMRKIRTGDQIVLFLATSSNMAVAANPADSFHLLLRANFQYFKLS